MYAFLDRIDADAFEAIAAQAYVEMLKAGYTAVAEFHYVHHDPQGKPYADPAELAHRIAAAADAAGIALTLLPVFYAHADFGGVPPTDGQRRSLHTLDTYAHVVAGRARSRVRRLHAGDRAPQSPGRDAGRAGRNHLPGPARVPIPSRMEQLRVAACVAWSGARPWNGLTHAGLDARWCVVHATHDR
jgi:cytosine/adenosine deaminase-related metal-dependent hydrolase